MLDSPASSGHQLCQLLECAGCGQQGWLQSPVAGAGGGCPGDSAVAAAASADLPSQQTPATAAHFETACSKQLPDADTGPAARPKHMQQDPSAFCKLVGLRLLQGARLNNSAVLCQVKVGEQV